MDQEYWGFWDEWDDCKKYPDPPDEDETDQKPVPVNYDEIEYSEDEF